MNRKKHKEKAERERDIAFRHMKAKQALLDSIESMKAASDDVVEQLQLARNVVFLKRKGI